MQGQFVSASAAAAFVLTDPITDCTRNSCPIIFPSWNIGSDNIVCQGRWRRYAIRLPFHEYEEGRDGYSRKVEGSELLVAFLFSRFQTIGRYLGDERDDYTEANIDGPAKTTKCTQSILSRHIWDGHSDSPTHPEYNNSLSEVLPGSRFVLTTGKRLTDAYRKLRNWKLQFYRFWEHDLSTKKQGNTVL